MKESNHDSLESEHFRAKNFSAFEARDKIERENTVAEISVAEEFRRLLGDVNDHLRESPTYIEKGRVLSIGTPEEYWCGWQQAAIKKLEDLADDVAKQGDYRREKAARKLLSALRNRLIGFSSIAEVAINNHELFKALVILTPSAEDELTAARDAYDKWRNS
jgi:hypothetical protein